ncbi:MAG: Fe-S cluster assembly ATPase SufC [Thermofilum sp.]|jgi:Fe-S cluster assembly ATP-binding protein|nr:Fe-S cluster assembly ATPase SufC [Thermofilum sp.]
MKNAGLSIEKLTASVAFRQLLRDVSLKVFIGEIVALIGPNGSGKTSLAFTVMGHPNYKIETGRILLDGEDITSLKPHERAHKGIFLVFQSPPDIGGLPVGTFLQEMTAKRGLAVTVNEINTVLLQVGLSEHHVSRNLYEGFSGGEKKRLEFAQALLFKPRILVLDELDSGLDIEGVRLLTGKIQELANSGVGVLYISHNLTALRLLKPDRVVVMMNGGIVAQDGLEIIDVIEEKGYQGLV